jgi:hypothetical protein
MLLFKYSSGPEVHYGSTWIVSGDTYRDCLCIDCHFEHTFQYWWMEYPVAIRADGHEIYAPGAGLVVFEQRGTNSIAGHWTLRSRSPVEP